MTQTITINADIELTEIRETDKAALAKHLNDKTIFDYTLMIPYPYTEANAEWFINFAREQEAKHGFVVKFAIRKHGALVGGIGLMLNDKETATHKAEIGYWIAQSVRNQGIMTHVLRGLTEFIFQTTHLVRLEATVFAPNIASQKALEKAGYEREGFARKFHIKDGVPLDVFLFSKVK
ncbi:MAG: GNAT family N-acetyltransferase [Saprospiraceae bacterium]|nr:GNAT family N-acetyltransferase [Saprospiraceae bacterium]